MLLYHLLTDTYTLRRGVEADLPQVLGLIQELAAYEQAPEAVTNTLAAMQRDGFGPAPIFGFFVLENAGGRNHRAGAVLHRLLDLEGPHAVPRRPGGDRSGPARRPTAGCCSMPWWPRPAPPAPCA